MEHFLFDVARAPGFIFGPLMLSSGLLASGACVWAARRGDRASARRALGFALAPVALGLLGAATGAAVRALNGGDKDWLTTGLWLGYTVLFGVFVALVPLAVSAALLRRRPVPTG